MIKKIIKSVVLMAAVIGATVALASPVVPAPMPIDPDMPGAWECTAADNTQHQWVHLGPNEALAQIWAVNLCQVDSDTPRSCHLLAASCHPVSLAGRWRCFAADYRENVHWRATERSPRWHAIHAAYQRCYRHSPRPETCYVNPAVCVHF